MKKFIQAANQFANKIVYTLEDAEEQISKLTGTQFRLVTYPEDTDPDDDSRVWVKLVDENSSDTVAGEYINKNASAAKIVKTFMALIKPYIRSSTDFLNEEIRYYPEYVIDDMWEILDDISGIMDIDFSNESRSTAHPEIIVSFYQSLRNFDDVQDRIINFIDSSEYAVSEITCIGSQFYIKLDNPYSRYKD